MVKAFIEDLGGGVEFVAQVFSTGIKKPCPAQALCDQIWQVTVQSLSTVSMAGFFVGAIMTIQFTLQMKVFGALGYLGGLATSGTIREVGPLLIAFLLSGKIGAYTSAELGTMRVTEQIDAIRCLGADPIQELILPRYLGIVISSFLLLAIGLLMAVFGGMFMGRFFSGISPQEYVRHIPTIVTGYSVAIGLFKCLIFSIVLSSVCTYRGYFAAGGSKGVGRAVIGTAVISMVGIVIADWLTSLIAETVLKAWMGL